MAGGCHGSYLPGTFRCVPFLVKNSLLWFRIAMGAGALRMVGSHLVLPRVGLVRMKEQLR